MLIVAFHLSVWYLLFLVSPYTLIINKQLNDIHFCRFLYWTNKPIFWWPSCYLRRIKTGKPIQRWLNTKASVTDRIGNAIWKMLSPSTRPFLAATRVFLRSVFLFRFAIHGSEEKQREITFINQNPTPVRFPKACFREVTHFDGVIKNVPRKSDCHRRFSLPATNPLLLLNLICSILASNLRILTGKTSS